MESERQSLAVKLDDFCGFLSKTFDINAGGCCFVAYVIAYCLEQDGIDYQVGVCTSLDYNEFYDIGCDSQNHYFIILDDFNINDDGECDYTIYDVSFAEDLLDHYLECTWNTDYDRSNNEFIEHLIKEVYVKFYEEIFQGESNCICI